LLTMNHGVTTQGCDDEVVSQLTLPNKSNVI